jgi:Carboxypeptidase regulatory-like domain
MWVGVLALLLIIPVIASAQNTASISGTVMDKSGAAVVGAQVILTSTGGNLTHTSETNSDGAYVFSALSSGTYDIVVTAKGFQRFTVKGVVVDVADKKRVDASLTVGSVTEEIVVTGESIAQVDTTSAEIGSTITGRQINELMLNGRNFTQLVTLSAGVVSQTNQDEGTVGVNGSVAYAMNGGRTEYNNWELDGGDNMDNGSNGTLNVYPNPEAIAEFKVLTSNYGAQYGRNGSGTIEVETKSGTNAWHGSGFFYGRNEMFNARSWEEGANPTAPKAPYNKYDWGYTIGGPVYIPNHYNADKKKTFFFWSQEWRKESNPSSFNVQVPSAAERAGNFSDLCPDFTGSFQDCPKNPATGNYFPSNTIPTGSISPNAQYFLNVIPTQTGSLTDGGGYPAYVQTVSLPTSWREQLIRLDHNFTENERLTVRYIHDSWQTTTATPLWGNGTSFDNVHTSFKGPGTSFVVRLASTFTPTLLNEFVASYTADHIDLAAIGPYQLPSGFSMPGLFNNGFFGKLPSFNIANGAAYQTINSNGSSYGGFNFDSGYFPWKNANPTYTYRDNMTKILGKHTLLLGAYLAAVQKNQENSLYTQGILTFNNSSTVSTGNAFADLLMGNISNYQQSNQQIIFYDRYKILEPYVQDDWRVTQRLTLNLGLRLSFFGRYQERYNQEYGFDPSLYVRSNAPVIDYTGNVTGSAGAFINPVTAPNVANSIFNGYIQCGVSPAPTGCYKNKLMNPAPRVGFAYDPKGDGKMAIRGGYGIFFEHTNGNEANAESLQQGASPLVLISNQPNISGYGNVGGAGLYFPINPWSIPNQVQWPYVMQWNLSVQKELPFNIVTSVAYVGSKGTHLTDQRDLNQLQPINQSTNPFQAGQAIAADGSDCNFNVNPSTGLPTSASLANGKAVPTADLPNLWVACQNSATPYRPYYGYGGINRLENGANSVYHALQITAQRTVGQVTFSTAYTYSHSLDDSSDRYDSGFLNSYNLRGSWASSNFDQRHSFSVSYVWAMPFFKNVDSKAARAVLSGWQVSGITVAQTGTPFNIINGTSYADSAGLGNSLANAGSRPDLVGNAHAVGQTQTAQTGPLYLNPAAFAVPQGLTYGTLGRNVFNYPGRLNFDMGLFKRFQINERSAFEFRWENYNTFNHTQFNSIGNSMDTTNPGDNSGSSGFLHLNGAHAPRRMQLGLRFYF